MFGYFITLLDFIIFHIVPLLALILGYATILSLIESNEKSRDPVKPPRFDPDEFC